MAHLVSDAAHAADVWECGGYLDAVRRQVGRIVVELGAQLAGPPQVREPLDVVVPPR
jgi:hypothetical protein